MNSAHIKLAEEVGALLLENELKLATAESCTGGGIAAAVTDVAGSSGWFDRGFVAYSNKAKQDLLGVNEATIARHGACSTPVACEMALGAVANSLANVAVSVTGIAGPSGGTDAKPVGSIWVAWADNSGIIKSNEVRFHGNRESIRSSTVEHALRGVKEYLEQLDW